MNAAIWFGTVIFFTFAAGPAFFSEEMIKLLGRPHAGAAAQVVLERFFHLQIWCAVIGMAHLMLEWLYVGRPIHRILFGTLVILLLVGWAGSAMLHPKLKRLHLVVHAPQTTAQQKEQARRSFAIWHGMAQTVNLLALGGLVFYLWRMTHGVDAHRYLSAGRFKT